MKGSRGWYGEGRSIGPISFLFLYIAMYTVGAHKENGHSVIGTYGISIFSITGTFPFLAVSSFQPNISLWKESLLYFGTFEIMADIVNVEAIATEWKRIISK